MANICEFRLSVQELRAAGGDRDLLTGLVTKELVILAKRLRMDPPMVWHLVDKTVDKVLEEIRKFSTDADRPYPPQGKHDMLLYVTMPELGKLAQGVEWKERVIV